MKNLILLIILLSFGEMSFAYIYPGLFDKRGVFSEEKNCNEISYSMNKSTTSHDTKPNKPVSLFVSPSVGFSSYFYTKYFDKSTTLPLGLNSELSLKVFSYNKRWFFCGGIGLTELKAKYFYEPLSYRYEIEMLNWNLNLNVERNIISKPKYQIYIESGLLYSFIVRDNYKSCNPDCSSISVYSDSKDTPSNLLFSLGLGGRIALYEKCDFFLGLCFRDSITPLVNVYQGVLYEHQDKNFINYFLLNAGVNIRLTKTNSYEK